MSSPKSEVYVINLARSRDRLAHVLAELAKTGLDHQRVEAVDGRSLRIDDPNLVAPDLRGQATFRPGAAGAALSHLSVYQRVVRSGAQTALVLEDDIILPSDLSGLVDAAAAEMTGAEVLLLNFHGTGPVRLSTRDMVPVPSERRIAWPTHLEGLTSGGAYMVTREACRRMEQAVLPLRTFPDDWAFYVGLGAIDRVRCIVPMPVRNSPLFRTTIDYYRPGSLTWRAKELLSSARVPMLPRLLAARRLREFQSRGWVGRAVLTDDAPVESPGK